MRTERKRRSRMALYLKLILAVIVCFTISCSVTAICCKAADAKAGELRSRYRVLNDQVENLKDKLTYVRSDDYVERVARDEFGLVMPGEYRYVTN